MNANNEIWITEVLKEASEHWEALPSWMKSPQVCYIEYSELNENDI